MIRQLGAGVLASVLLTACVGCGQDDQSSTTQGSVPAALTSRLGAVDTALSGHHYGAGERALHRLISATKAARRAGDVTDQQADRILAAARQLLGLLPDSSPADKVTAAPTDDGSQPAPSPGRAHSKGPGPSHDQATESPTPAPTESASPTPTPNAPTSSATAAPSSSPTTAGSAVPSGQARATSSPSPSPSG